MKDSGKKEIKQLIFGSLCSLIVIAVMIFFSEVMKEKEIIFPEIAALCIVYFLMPRLIWKTSYVRMLFFITLCAVMGVLIVLYIPLPLWLQVTFAFGLGQLIFFFSESSVVPMISAIALPVLIQTKSYIYIISAFGLTANVVLFSLLLEKGNIRAKNESKKTHLPWKEFFANFIFRTVLVLPVAFLCSYFNWRFKFCVAPPLLVAFTELTTHKESPPAKRPFATIILFALCSIFGSACRYIMTIRFGFPLTLSAVVAMTGVIILMKSIMKLPFPPAAAMCILAMLIPEEIVLYYPLEVITGITIFTVSALFWRKILWRKKKEEAKVEVVAKNNEIENEKSNKKNEVEIDISDKI